MNATINSLVEEFKAATKAQGNNVVLVKTTHEPSPTYFVAGGKTPATPDQIIAAMQIARVVIRFF